MQLILYIYIYDFWYNGFHAIWGKEMVKSHILIYVYMCGLSMAEMAWSIYNGRNGLSTCKHICGAFGVMAWSHIQTFQWPKWPKPFFIGYRALLCCLIYGFRNLRNFFQIFPENSQKSGKIFRYSQKILKLKLLIFFFWNSYFVFIWRHYFFKGLDEHDYGK